MVLFIQGAEMLHFVPHGLIDCASGGVVGRDDDGVLGLRGVTLRDGFDASLRVGNLSDAPLLLEHTNTNLRLTDGKMLNGFEQFGVFLPHDLVKLGRLHSGLLHLLEGLSGIDALMLASVAFWVGSPALRLRARKPCKVSAGIPASRSWAAARDVGANPSTAYPFCSAPCRIFASDSVLKLPINV
jgi:hypothetical protein